MQRSVLLKIMVLCYGLAALAGVAAIIAPKSFVMLDLLWTTLTVAGVLTLTLLLRVLAVVGYQRIRYLMELGWISACVSGACVILLIWFYGPTTMAYLFDEIGLGSLVLCLAILHIGFIFYWPLQDTVFRVVRWVVVAINLFFLLQLELLFINDEILEDFIGFLGSDLYGRIIGALVILLVCGTVSIPLGYLISRTRQNRSDQAGLSQGVLIPVQCPRCGCGCELHVGHSTCPQCKLCFQLKLEEPRCRCGYLLFRVASEDCPECGRAIPEHVRWKMIGQNSEPST